VRLHYAYPTAVTDELIEVIASEPKVAKYLDVPLQHIDDRVLKLMRRGHTARGATSWSSGCAARVPDIVIRTTFLVGHPGEDEAAFERLSEFVRATELDRVGVFTFSPEEGTVLADPAASRPRGRARSGAPRSCACSAASPSAPEALVGRELEVLVEGVSDESEYLLRAAGRAGARRSTASSTRRRRRPMPATWSAPA
jgi:ribosomal protein S12 methylthiotransferase